jgi:hypothetical protein
MRFQDGKLVYKSQSNLTDRKGTDDVTMAKFNKVDTGASYDTVKGVIGSEGEVLSVNKGYKSIMSTYKWKNADGGYISATFKDDKLENKRQYKLK